ncbi:cytochrome P450 monooxygenase [Thelonectria olida]|uniref:Cytochrome P450 monooxygenase n=1 Tax=Thelonectria olida TaxID=1576542 RepID=A0A9P8VUA4_9HYPO|nr:cytochrome P450 monooxygenase [Thelonectria olida]
MTVLRLYLNEFILCALLGMPLYIIILVFYRLALHPLAKYPGPVLARITNWYSAFYVWKGDMHLKLFEMHQKYGETVRFGPNSISVNSRSAMAGIYGVRANVRKADSYAVMSASSRTVNTISSRDKKAHAFKRRILAQVFSDQALKGVEERILGHIRHFCRELSGNGLVPHSELQGPKDEWGSVLDMAAFCDYLAFDIISSLCYGESFNMLGSSGLRHLPNIVSAISRRNAICFVQPIVWRARLDHLFLASLSARVKAFSAWVREKAERRTQLGSSITQKDCFHYMLNAEDPETGKGFSDKELWCESLQLIIAGSDTTAVALSAVFFHLLHNPKILARLTQEVRSTFSNDEDIRSGQRLNSCTYLRACIQEALRRAPPVTGLAPRQVLPGGITVGSNRFPEGTIIGTPIYTIHHNRAYFPEPFVYKPERWIVDLDHGWTKESVDLARSAFSPFSIGPRSCIAKNMAWMELTITVARTLYLYDMKLDPRHSHGKSDGCVGCPGKPDTFEYRLKGWMTSGREGPLVQFKPVRVMN